MDGKIGSHGFFGDFRDSSWKSPSLSGIPSKRSRRSLSRPIQHIDRADPKPGQYWQVLIDNLQWREVKEWPAVIIDEEMLGSYFKKDCEPRPMTAPDRTGTWRLEVEPTQKSFPIMLLGIWRFLWAKRKDLRPFDKTRAPLKQQLTNDTELAAAYEIVIAEADRVNIQYWKDKMLAYQYEQDPNSPPQVEPARTPFKEGKYGLDWDGVEDDDEGLPELPKLLEIKKEPAENSIPSTAAAKNSSVHDNSESEDSPRPSKRRKVAASSTPISPKSSSPEFTKSRSSTRRRSTKDTKATSGQVKLYVGNPHKIFEVKKQGLQIHCPLLAAQLSNEFRIGDYVMCPTLSKIKPLNFEPAAEFINRTEYTPIIIAERTKDARLENIDNKQARRIEVMRCGQIYRLAVELKICGLENLAIRKLKVLGNCPAFEFLSTVDLIYLSDPPPSGDNHEFFVDYISANYWNFIRYEKVRFVDLAESNRELMRRVHAKLGMPNEKDIRQEEDQEEIQEKNEESEVTTDETDALEDEDVV